MKILNLQKNPVKLTETDKTTKKTKRVPSERKGSERYFGGATVSRLDGIP